MNIISQLFRPRGYNREIEVFLDTTSMSFDERCKSICALLHNRTSEEFRKVSAWLQDEVSKRKWEQKERIKLTLYLYGIVLGVEAGAIKKNEKKWEICMNTEGVGLLKNKKVQIVEFLNERGQETILITDKFDNTKHETPRFLNN